MSFYIVPAQEEHIEALNEAFSLVARERIYLATTEASNIEDTRKLVMDAPQNRDIILLALEGQRLVGWVGLWRMKHVARRHIGNIGMGVIKEWRGQGIGKALLEKAIEMAWTQDFTRLQLQVFNDNKKAIGLYEGLGFKTEGVFLKYVKIDGVFRDGRQMALLG